MEYIANTTAKPYYKCQDCGKVFLDGFRIYGGNYDTGATITVTGLTVSVVE